ncbi:MAG: hypothetical protein SGI74_08015 [Oligoflexia bacterium]|nr:hypothetical protein [Oligoflexia bacterium]
MKLIYFALLASLITAGLNCSTRKRTAELEVGKDAVEAKLSQLSSKINASTFPEDAVIKENMKTFIKMHAEPGSTMFFAESPGSMGPIDIVMPLKHNGFFDNAQESVKETNLTKTYAFFVITNRANGVRGALIIAGKDKATPAVVAAPTPTPVPGATPAQVVPAAAPSNAGIDVNFVRIGINDDGVLVPGRNIALNPGVYTENDFGIELNLHNKSALIVRSDDILDEEGDVDLTDVIKLQLSRIINGKEVFLGQMILTQPE